MSWNWNRWLASLTGLTLIIAAAVAPRAQEAGDDGAITLSEDMDLDGGPDYGEVTLGYGPEVPKFGEDIYRVVRGDTLWGICSRFFGDPYQWPGLWSINNEEITNPHYIYPGQILRFRPGTDIYPPSLIVGRPDSGAYGYDEEFEDVVRFLAGQRECGIHRPFSQKEDRYRLSAPGFIVDDPRREDAMDLGVVAAAPEIGLVLGQDDTIYIQFDRDTAEDVNCGDIYTLYHPVHEVTHPHVRKASVGNLYRISGEVRITDINLRTDIATGKLIESWSEVERGHLVTDRIPVSSMITEREMRGQIEGYVIDKLAQENSLMQAREVVFIDRGRNSGIENGTVLWVMRQRDHSVSLTEDDDRLPMYVIGKLVVFSAEEGFATAVLVEAAEDVDVGDRVLTVIEEAEL